MLWHLHVYSIQFKWHIQQIHLCRGLPLSLKIYEFVWCVNVWRYSTVSRISYASVDNWLPWMLYLPKMPQRWHNAQPPNSSPPELTHQNKSLNSFRDNEEYTSRTGLSKSCHPWEFAAGSHQVGDAEKTSVFEDRRIVVMARAWLKGPILCCFQCQFGSIRSMNSV